MTERKFTFRLQTVLDVHEMETERARLELSQASNKVRAQSAKVDQIRAEIDESQKPGLAPSNSQVALLRRDGTYRMQLQRELAKEERLLSALLRAEADSRKKLIRKRTKEETVRSLRDTALTEHRLENNRIENNETDELAMIAASRRRRKSA